jgi:hypothetical protein
MGCGLDGFWGDDDLFRFFDGVGGEGDLLTDGNGSKPSPIPFIFSSMSKPFIFWLSSVARTGISTSESVRLFAETWLPLLWDVNGRESSNEPRLLSSSPIDPLIEGDPFVVPLLAARLVVMCNGSEGSNRPGLPGILLPLMPGMNMSVGDICYLEVSNGT